MDPTKTTYAELQAAWRHFNKALFDNQLPPCLVTLQRRANARGYFRPSGSSIGSIARPPTKSRSTQSTSSTAPRPTRSALSSTRWST